MLWEFNDQVDADMGTSIGISFAADDLGGRHVECRVRQRLQQRAQSRGALCPQRCAPGVKIAEVDTGIGGANASASCNQAVGPTDCPNGLSSAVIVDSDLDGVGDTIPAVDYLAKDEKVQRWVLEGTDYVYPRTTNKILEAYLKSKGVKPEDISINYTPFGHADWQTRVAAIKKFGSEGKKTAVVSTINGDANVPFYKELANQGVKATDIPVVAFSVGEEELAGIDTKPLVGHLAAWNYFQSIDTPENKAFIEKWHAFTKNPKRVTNDPMEAHYIGFNMWVKAVEKAGTTDPDKVIEALPGIKTANLTGGTSEMLPNHHITKPVFIGEIEAGGQFDVVWKTNGLVPGDAWSKELEGSRDLEADWVGKKCGNFNTKTGKCGGA